jgi:hypothetical protein
MKRLMLVFLLLIAPLGSAWAVPSGDQAVSAAKTWLAIVDAGKYEQSWKDAADLFQSGVSEERWVKMVSGIREKLGELKSREYQSVELTKSLPGVPDGDYANVGFHSAFENKAEADEVITLILEKGKWKVGGYHIK